MKQYILFDESALVLGTADATVFDSGDTLEELVKVAPDYGGGVIYSYDVEKIRSHKNLINETFEKHIKG